MKKILLVLTVCLSASFLVQAESFQILGARATGMGGASVAVGGDNKSNSEALTQYWNPAALALHSGVDVEIPAGAGVEATGGLLNYAKNISDMSDQYSKIQDAQRLGKTLTLDQIKSFTDAVGNLSGLNQSGLGVLGQANGGLNVSTGKFSVSVNSFNSIGADPNVDLKNLYIGSGTGISGVNFNQAGINTATPGNAALSAASTSLAGTISTLVASSGASLGGLTALQAANAIINAASITTSVNDIVSAVNAISANQPLVSQVLSSANSGTSFKDNTSNVTLQALSMNELSFGYGHDLSFLSAKLKNLYVGGNLKYIQGRMGYYKETVWNSGVSKSGDLYSDATKDIKTSSNVGVDLGVLYEFDPGIKTRVGVLARNINAPQFKRSADAVNDGFDDKYKVDPQYRAGIALWPASWLLFSADYDLNKSDTLVEGYKSQYYGCGAELNLINRPAFNLALRGGIMKNTANSDSKMAYTAGLGINFLHVIIELSGAISSDKVEIQDGKEIPSDAYAALSVGMHF